VTGSIGYVEYAFARQTRLVWTAMVNADGQRVQPAMKSFEAAAANAGFSDGQDFTLNLADQPGAQSWPITAATYMLMRGDAPAAKNRDILQFLAFALHDPADAARLDYVPLPGSLVARVEASWKKNLKAGP
jgi:phosphate transport system substrate-binding protein